MFTIIVVAVAAVIVGLITGAALATATPTRIVDRADPYDQADPAEQTSYVVSRADLQNVMADAIEQAIEALIAPQLPPAPASKHRLSVVPTGGTDTEGRAV